MSMNKSRVFYRLFSLLLVFVLVTASLSLPAVAQDAEEAELETEYVEQNPGDSGFELIPNDEPAEEFSAVEDTSRREANVKHFDLGYGNFEAIVYPAAVHRKDAEGNWQDIDNRLSAKSTGRYETADGRTAVAARAGTKEPLISVEENGYRIAMTPVSGNMGGIFDSVATKDQASGTLASSVAQIRNHADPEKKMSGDLYAKADTTTRVTYESVYSGVDIEYVLIDNDVKENIIVNAPASEYSYTFVLAIRGLYAVLEENGDIVLYDAESEEEQYVMPAPYMYDANGETSYDVWYILKETDTEGVYTITVEADEGWFSKMDRAFPVVIDPTITKTYVVRNAYLDGNEYDLPHDNAEWMPLSVTQTILYKFAMPFLPAGSTLDSASLYVQYYFEPSDPSDTVSIWLSQVSVPWDNDVTLEELDSYPDGWLVEGSPFFITQVSGGKATASSPQWLELDVTAAVNNWRHGDEMHGICIEWADGTTVPPVYFRSLKGSVAKTRAYCTVKYTLGPIPSGVYRLKNLATNQYLEIKNGGYTSGTTLRMNAKSTDAADRKQLFKLTHTGYVDENAFSYLTIRPMTNSGLGILGDYFEANSPVTVVTMDPNDASSSIGYPQHWAIKKISGGDGTAGVYTISCGPENNTSYLSGVSDGVSVRATKSTSIYSRWKFEPYDEEANGAIEGITFYPDFPGIMIPGESFTFRAAMYSSTIGRNGPVTFSVVNPADNGATDLATIGSTSGTLTARNVGQVKVRLTYAGSSLRWLWYVNIEKSLEGTYFIQNAEFGNYMQLDDGGGNIFELWDFDGENDQRWEFIYVSNGYYKIQSVSTGKVATSPDGLEHSVWQDDYNGRDNQLWKITDAGNGQYKFSSKKYPSYYMAAGDSNNGSDGRHVDLRSNRSDGKDEWQLTRMLPTSGYELNYEPSRWSGYVQNCCNCYAYALNNQVVPGSNTLWFKQQMGYYKGTEYIFTELTEQDIYAAVDNDFDSYNEQFDTSLVFQRIGRYEVCPAGTYKVALVVSDGDYHWYRQDADGLWSHKRGLSPVERTDYSGNLIVDPYIADRGSYTEFLGYYAVTPWSNLFAADGTVYCFINGLVVPYDVLINYLNSLQYSQHNISSYRASEDDMARIASMASASKYEMESFK